MLCHLCASISYDDLVTASEPPFHIGTPHHTSYHDLLSCKNCDFCLTIVRVIAADKYLLTQSDSQEWQEYPMYLRLFPSDSGLGDESDLSNLLVYCNENVEHSQEEKTLSTMGLFLQRTEEEWETGIADSAESAASLIGGRPVSERADADDCFRLANAWLDKCVGKSRGLDFHDVHHGSDSAANTCLAKSSTSELKKNVNGQALGRFVPHRTIDVGPPDGTQEPRLVCHDNGNDTTNIAWSTLSHCWGGSAPLATTLNNIDYHRQAITLSKMPATFRDAVIITRRLGIRHLWIDSLCIIQDSPADWKMEASVMGNIYIYGLLNIAAGTGRGCHDGIFTNREAISPPVKLPLKSKTKNISSHMYARPGRWYNPMAGIFGVESSLTSRGWVFQESLLSPRTLHYAREQLTWECRHFTLVEGSLCLQAKQGLITSRSRWVSNKMVLPPNSLQSPPPNITVETDVERRAETYNSWLQLITNYTNRRLTFPSDIFVALAGVAAVFQANLGDRYLAGMFEGDLLTSLLWKTLGLNSTTKRLTPLIPSWSWAAIIGAVVPLIETNSNMVSAQRKGKLTAGIVEAHVDLHNGNMPGVPLSYFTDIAGGFIVVEGQILEQSGDLETLSYKSRTREVSQPATSKPVNSTSPMNYERDYLSFDIIEAAVSAEEQPLAILHMGAWEWWYRGRGTAPSSFRRVFAGLLLQATDSSKTKYRRVGVASMDVGVYNVSDDTVFQDDDEAFLRGDGWMRKTVRII